MKLRECDFTIFDVETTGLAPYTGDRICEIAAIRVDYSCKKTGKFDCLVDPLRPISYGAFMINGITSQMVTGKPTIDKVLPDFFKFAAGSVLVAYNAGFDLAFLESAMGEERENLRDYPVVDALGLARRFFPKAGRYNLGLLARHLGIETPLEHRALADASMAWRVFEKELAVMASYGIEDVEDIAYSKQWTNAIREQETLNIKP
ncbi:MAG: 3'-5' exonuclease [Candidatus Omnitrophota bacterium]